MPQLAPDASEGPPVDTQLLKEPRSRESLYPIHIFPPDIELYGLKSESRGNFPSKAPPPG